MHWHGWAGNHKKGDPGEQGRIGIGPRAENPGEVSAQSATLRACMRENNAREETKSCSRVQISGASPIPCAGAT